MLMIEMKEILLSINIPPSNELFSVWVSPLSYWNVSLNPEKLFTSNGQGDNGHTRG
jgi:hypothetical protein